MKLTEYRAKKILLGDSYAGISINETQGVVPTSGKWVAKVDQGVKKRFKQGLVVIDKSAADMQQAIESWQVKGFSQFIIEPLLPHDNTPEQGRLWQL